LEVVEYTSTNVYGIVFFENSTFKGVVKHEFCT